MHLALSGAGIKFYSGNSGHCKHGRKCEPVSKYRGYIAIGKHGRQ